MSLQKGSRPEVVSANLRSLAKSGHSHKEALSIALSKALRKRTRRRNR